MVLLRSMLIRVIAGAIVLAFSHQLLSQEVYPDYRDGYLYVVADADSIGSVEELQALTEGLELDVLVREITVPFTIGGDTLDRTYKVYFDPPQLVDEFMRVLNAHDHVEFAERIPLTRIFFRPNDPLYLTNSYGYNWSWYLDVIEAESAWDIHTGSSTINVAVVDNAVYTDHPDLKNKVRFERDVSDNNTNAAPPPGGSIQDKYMWSHGTHIAGLVAAETNNAEGIASIGFDILLIAVKSAPNNSSGQYTYNGAAGVQWAAQVGADIINVSWGSTGYSAVQNNFYNNLRNNGVLVVAAAGNEGNQGNEKIYPAGYNSVIAVGSTNYDDTRSSFSQYGPWLDVSAPGGFFPSENSTHRISLLSTTYNEAYVAQGAISGKYDIKQGTSMAAPLVAGLLGLMKSAYPGAHYDHLRNCLLWGSENIDNQNAGMYAGQMGAGRINALNSMRCVTGTNVNETRQKPLTISPNPSQGVFYIAGLKETNYTVRLLDITGKLILEKIVHNNKVKVPAAKPGVYILEINTGKEHYVERVMIR